MALQLDAILGFYIEVLQIGHFLLFDALDQIPFVLNLFALLLAVLKVVQTSLLRNVLVLADLILQSHLVSLESSLLLRLQLVLALFVELLLLDNTAEFSAYAICLPYQR